MLDTGRSAPNDTSRTVVMRCHIIDRPAKVSRAHPTEYDLTASDSLMLTTEPLPSKFQLQVCEQVSAASPHQSQGKSEAAQVY